MSTSRGGRGRGRSPGSRRATPANRNSQTPGSAESSPGSDPLSLAPSNSRTTSLTRERYRSVLPDSSRPPSAAGNRSASAPGHARRSPTPQQHDFEMRGQSANPDDVMGSDDESMVHILPLVLSPSESDWERNTEVLADSLREASTWLMSRSAVTPSNISPGVQRFRDALDEFELALRDAGWATTPEGGAEDEQTVRFPLPQTSAQGQHGAQGDPIRRPAAQERPSAAMQVDGLPEASTFGNEAAVSRIGRTLPRPAPQKPTIPYQPQGPPPPINLRTKPRGPSYAYKARTAVKPAPGPQSNVETLASLARALPNLPAKRIVEIQQQGDSQGSAKRQRRTAPPSFTSKGPTRKQLLVAYPSEDVLPREANLPLVCTRANKALRDSGSPLKVISVTWAYRGLSLATSAVPQPKEIDLLRGSIYESLPRAKQDKPWVGLPQSTSYLKVLDVPYFSDANLTVRTTREEVESALRHSPLADSITLTGAPRIDRTSQHSSTGTAYFNIWDSQNGSNARRLINQSVFINGTLCRIAPAAASPGVSLCTRCWRWGHPAKFCRARLLTCPKCGGPHEESQHRHMASCCKGHPKATPPIPPTPADVLACPHTDRCPSCSGPHSATSSKCPFWKHRFDREWIEAKYSEVRATRSRNPRSSNATRPSV